MNLVTQLWVGAAAALLVLALVAVVVVNAERSYGIRSGSLRPPQTPAEREASSVWDRWLR